MEHKQEYNKGNGLFAPAFCEEGREEESIKARERV